MKPYLVRLKPDQNNPREIVGFFVSPSLNHLADLIDECCPPEDCEYRELGPGSIFWGRFTNSSVPRAKEPDWESVPDGWSVIPSDPTLSQDWDDVFRAPDDLAADDALWAPVRWENDTPEKLEEAMSPIASCGLPTRTPPRRGPR